MKFPLSNISIQRKLILMQVTTAIVVLAIVITVFATVDIKGFKDKKVISTNAIARVIGNNSIFALEEKNSKAAKELLSELSVQPDILNASILDIKGDVFPIETIPCLPIQIFLCSIRSKRVMKR